MNWTITKIASVVLCAMGSGLALSSLGHSPVLGYIIAGILLGPSGFQFIIDREAIGLFSEMGILFLLFAIGLNLSFEKIRNIWKTSIATTLISTAFIYIIILGAGWFLKLTHNQVVLIAFCVTLSSTAVTVKSLKGLKDRDDNIEENTFGILIAQDLIALAMALIINFMGPRQEADHQLHRVVAVLLFVSGLVFYFSWYHRHIHKITNFIKKHDDMLTLTVFGICLGGAVLAELAGLSAPFGAFIMGLILGNSNLREQVKSIATPIEEILLMTFFLSVGLLVDLEFIFHNLLIILSSLVFVTFGKTIINIFILRLYKFPLKESFVIGVLLGHIGEFSFMLSYSARKVGLIDSYGVKYLLSLTALSLFLSPFWLIFAERCRTIAKSVNVVSSWEFFKLASSGEGIKLRNIRSIFNGFGSSMASLFSKLKELWNQYYKK
ncbi:MAG: cation:proton antiporter [Holosporaceae bacterium]|jgi:CPA2 family monovalent cation:H+ antiporter-2|nr:cation:proton antiporter [Holosporaceae bacterium]